MCAPEAAPYENPPLALGVILGWMAAAAFPLVKLLLQRTRGAAAKAQLLELVNDQLGLLAALAALAAIRWSYPIADPIASIVVAMLIAANGIVLFRQNASLLHGRSPGPEFLARVESAACAVPGVVAVRDLRAEYIELDTVHAGLRVEAAPDLPVAKPGRIAREIETRLHEGAHVGHCFIQVEPGALGAGAPPLASSAALAREPPLPSGAA